MTLPRLACLLLLYTLATATHAECECLWQGDFSQVQGETDLVVSASVVSAKGNSIDLAVDQLLRGPTGLEQTRVWLQTGDYCRPPVADFPIGTQWVMALLLIDERVPGGFNPSTPNISYGRIGDYRLSSCGGYWLRQTGNRVTGNLVKAPRWVRDPQMTPVLLDLVAGYVAGTVSREALLEASREDPALQDLMLDTRAFLREER